MNAGSKSGPKATWNVFTIVLVVLTLHASLVAPILAIALAGAGHGWVSAIRVSWIALITGPLAAVGWVFRRKWWGQVLALIILACTVAADHALAQRTNEEPEYFANVWRLGAHVVIAWLVVWLYLHVVLIAPLGWGIARALLRFWDGRRPAPSDSDEPYKPVG